MSSIMPSTGNFKKKAAASHAWTYLTNHTHVLVCLAEDAELRVRDMAARIGITERAVQRIIVDLEEAGVLTRERAGRRNRYVLHGGEHLRHPLEAHCSVGALVDWIRSQKRPPRRSRC